MVRLLMVALLCGTALAGCRRAPPVEAVVVDPGAPLPSAATLPRGTVAGTVPSGALDPGPVSLASIAGTYRGRSELVRSEGRCPAGGNVALRMRDPAVRFRVNRTVPELVAPVALDGFFAADNGVSVIRGRILPDRMEFDAGTLQCGYRYILARTA